MKRTIAKRSRRKRVRSLGTPQRPRLTVYRSLKHIYAQVVDDLSGRTLVATSTVRARVSPGGSNTAAAQVGKQLAELAKGAGIDKVRFDRGRFRYHGRVKALADAAREGGLSF